jgi:hypothetical protein
MPSVDSLDKEAEEESKKDNNKTEKDLLLLLKSPDIEVKVFPKPSLPQIVSSQDVEKKKQEILQLLQEKPDKKGNNDNNNDDDDYESIRFEREHLDPKSCLGFAHLDSLKRPLEEDGLLRPQEAGSHITLNHVDLSESLSLSLSLSLI